MELATLLKHNTGTADSPANLSSTSELATDHDSPATPHTSELTTNPITNSHTHEVTTGSLMTPSTTPSTIFSITPSFSSTLYISSMIFISLLVVASLLALLLVGVSLLCLVRMQRGLKPAHEDVDCVMLERDGVGYGQAN